MKYEIMLKILFELLSKKTVKASYLAQKYECSIRSIYRYVNCLELAGIPLYTTRGNQGGISIVDTYRFAATFMTQKEFEQTIAALTAIINEVPNKEIDSVINKLKSARRNECSGLNLKSGNLIIDAGPWGDTVGYKSKLTIIQKSIDDNKMLSIKYHDRNGEITTRIIEPHLILFKQGLWYVFAYCHLRDDFRFFKTGRIEQATLLEESFVRRDLSDKELPLNFWHADLPTIDVVLQVQKSCLSDVEEWLGIENVQKIADEFIASAKLPSDNGLVSKIISFGNGIKVLEPVSLAKQVKEVSEKIVNMYK